MRIIHKSELTLLTALVITMTGCAATETPVETDSPKESQVKLLTLLDETQELIGGEWENEDSPSPRGCELPGSATEGVAFTGLRSQKMPALDDATVSKVLKLWEAEGFEAGKGGMGVLDSVLGVQPENKAYYVELRIGEYSTQLHGQSACVPGDVLEELDRVKEEFQG